MGRGDGGVGGVAARLRGGALGWAWSCVADGEHMPRLLAAWAAAVEAVDVEAATRAVDALAAEAAAVATAGAAARRRERGGGEEEDLRRPRGGAGGHGGGRRLGLRRVRRAGGGDGREGAREGDGGKGRRAKSKLNQTIVIVN